jgi:hypothetical protein
LIAVSGHAGAGHVDLLLSDVHLRRPADDYLRADASLVSERPEGLQV